MKRATFLVYRDPREQTPGANFPAVRIPIFSAFFGQTFAFDFCLGNERRASFINQPEDVKCKK